MDYEISLLKQIGKVIILVALWLLGIHTYIGSIILVHQDSMNPTLHDGDYLLTNKFGYLINSPKIGDIVIILKEEPTGIGKFQIGKTLQDYISNVQGTESRARYVKRVVAVANDVVEFKEGYLYVNGEKVIEDYTQGQSYITPEIYFENEYPLIVPEGHVYVLGDNREYSLDSRHFGTVPLSRVEAKVVSKQL